MRCLTIIMMFNLYPIKKLTTINNARAIFLMELKEKTFIDINSHIFDTIVDETRTTSRPKLIFPSLLMRTFRKKGVAIPQDISPMSTPSTINKQTFKRISVCLPEVSLASTSRLRRYYLTRKKCVFSVLYSICDSFSNS